uniref:zinc finger BED domain-containing protein 4-like n=1 Tax=Myxine glutinosa TaxID=7769 RepID=UPI00358DF1F0
MTLLLLPLSFANTPLLLFASTPDTHRSSPISRSDLADLQALASPATNLKLKLVCLRWNSSSRYLIQAARPDQGSNCACHVATCEAIPACTSIDNEPEESSAWPRFRSQAGSWLEIPGLPEESLRAVVTGLGVDLFGGLCARGEPAPVRDRLCALSARKFTFTMHAELSRYMESCRAGRGSERTAVPGRGSDVEEGHDADGVVRIKVEDEDPVDLPRGRDPEDAIRDNRFRTFPCSLCSHSFTTQAALKMHAKRHQLDSREKEYKCTEYPFRVHNENNLMAATQSRSKSMVWSYFTSLEDGTAVQCNICAVKVSQGARNAAKRNTSNMWGHLRSRHKEAFEEAHKERMVQQSIAMTASSESTLQQVFDRPAQWSAADTRSKTFDRLILEMIATDVQPFAMVSNVGFQRLMSAVEPKYILKSENFYRTEMLNYVHQKVVEKIKGLISKENAGDSISFTTDCWSGFTETLMSLTAHFIDSNWKRVQVVLNVKEMSDSHTGDYIGCMFVEILEHWDIDKERVLMVLRDSGANMIQGMRLVDMPDLSCIVHTLQLVINDGLVAQRIVGDILAKLEQCAVHFNHSVIGMQRLHAIQEELGLPAQTILQAVPTRWDSSLHMLRRTLQQKRALVVYASEYGHFVCPNAEEWDIVSSLVETLTPFEEITLEMSKAKSSASSIIPSLAVLKQLLQSQRPNTRGIRTLRSTMLLSLTKRFAKVEETKAVVLACLLDPRFKERPFSSDMVLSKAKEWLGEESNIESRRTNTPETTTEGGDPKKPRVVEESRSLLDDIYASVLCSQTEQPVAKGITEEIECYLREPVVNRRSGDPLEWWKQNSVRYKALSPMARRYLCAPPSSVPSERVFSTVGNIYDDKRSFFGGENTEKLCFLHYNLPLLEWQY